MDPITQGTIGAVYSQSFSLKKEIKKAALIGALGGMAPDLDIFIRSSSDPMVYFEYHRQFTHSLFFIPFGSFVVATFLYLLFFRKSMPFKRVYLYAFLGYATHGLLDACTSYGTLLFWPFSNYRFSWNNVSIIDPLYTLPLLALVFTSMYRKSLKPARFAILYSFFYLFTGVYFNGQAEKEGYKLAESRGHTPVRLEAKPTFANLILWKIIYEHDGKFYTDAIKVYPEVKVFPGSSILKLDLERDYPWIEKGSQHYVDIKKFQWFSQDFLGIHPEHKNVIGDIRYSVSPNDVYPLWGIKLNEKNVNGHVIRMSFRGDNLKKVSDFWALLFD